MPLENALGHAPLLMAMRERADINFVEALAEGAPEGAVLILDVRDPDAAAIAAQAAGADVAAIVAAAEARGVRPLVAWGVPRAMAVELLGGFPDVALTVAVPLGEAEYWIVVVADGSASAAMTPRPDRGGVGATDVIATP